MLAELAGVLHSRSQWRCAQLKSGKLQLGQASRRSFELVGLLRLLQAKRRVCTGVAWCHLTALTLPKIAAMEHNLAGDDTATGTLQVLENSVPLECGIEQSACSICREPFVSMVNRLTVAIKPAPLRGVSLKIAEVQLTSCTTDLDNTRRCLSVRLERLCYNGLPDHGRDLLEVFQEPTKVQLAAAVSAAGQSLRGLGAVCCRQNPKVSHTPPHLPINAL